MLKKIRDRNLHTWLGGWIKDRLTNATTAPKVSGTRHLVFAFCDHYEPLWGKCDYKKGYERVRVWHENYPKLCSGFRDSDGRPPQHSFFFPTEEFREDYFELITDMVRQGLGEVELHMHFDGWTDDRFREEILRGLEIMGAYGHFSRDEMGNKRYAFIHGNWALANGRPDGRWSGVDNELPVLWETGCYADYTFPAAPDICQPNIVNQIYWPTGDLARKRAYEWGERARVGRRYRDRLLLIQGPIALARKEGKLSGRIESAAVTDIDPGTATRVHNWVDQNIHVEGRPEWVFVKVHTHGCPDDQAASLLFDGGRTTHSALAEHYNDGKNWKLHYVTAREMFNIARAAMDGKAGNPNQWRDYELAPPPVRKVHRGRQAAE